MERVLLGVVKQWETYAVLDKDGEILHLLHRFAEREKQGCEREGLRWETLQWDKAEGRSTNLRLDVIYLCRAPALDLACLHGVVETNTLPCRNPCNGRGSNVNKHTHTQAQIQ